MEKDKHDIKKYVRETWSRIGPGLDTWLGVMVSAGQIKCLTIEIKRKRGRLVQSC